MTGITWLDAIIYVAEIIIGGIGVLVIIIYGSGFLGGIMEGIERRR